jgi:dolichol kinase
MSFVVTKRQKIIAAISLIAVIILYSPLTGGMNIGVAALLTGAAGTALSGVIAYLAMVLLQVFRSPTNAKDYAKIWFGYIFALLCVIRLNLFLIYLEIEYLAQFVLLIIVYGALAAIFGYLFGKYKLRKGS